MKWHISISAYRSFLPVSDKTPGSHPRSDYFTACTSLSEELNIELYLKLRVNPPVLLGPGMTVAVAKL